MGLNLGNTVECEKVHTQEADAGLIQYMIVYKALVFPWARSSRIVCADSYVASVSAAEEPLKVGLRFVGL